MNTFFIIVKNKILFNQILDKCKELTELKISFGYFDAPWGYFCRNNRFDLFDKRWNEILELNIEVIDGADGDIRLLDRYIMDFTRQDVISFFKFNTCFERFTKVWAKYQDYIQRVDLDREVLIHAIECRADTRIIQTLLDYLYQYSSHHFTKALETSVALGSIEIFTLLYKKHIVLDKYNKTGIYNELMLNACKAKHIDLALHIIKTVLFPRGYTDYDLSPLPGKVCEFILKLYNNAYCFHMSQYPPENCEAMYFKNIYPAHYVSLTEMAKINNTALLKTFFEYIKEKRMHASPAPSDLSLCQSVETANFFIDQFPNTPWNVDLVAIHSTLNVLKLLVEKGYRLFTSVALGAPFKTLEYLFDSQLLDINDPPEFKECHLFTGNLSVESIKLLARIYKQDFRVSYSFLNLFLGKQAQQSNFMDLLGCLLENDVVSPIDSHILKQITIPNKGVEIFCLIYRYLNAEQKSEFIKNIQIFTQQVLPTLLVDVNIPAIKELYSRFELKPLYKFITLKDSYHRAFECSYIYKLYYRGLEERDRLFYGNALLKFAYTTSNINLLRYLESLNISFLDTKKIEILTKSDNSKSALLFSRMIKPTVILSHFCKSNIILYNLKYLLQKMNKNSGDTDTPSIKDFYEFLIQYLIYLKKHKFIEGIKDLCQLNLEFDSSEIDLFLHSHNLLVDKDQKRFPVALLPHPTLIYLERYGLDRIFRRSVQNNQNTIFEY
ncbi:hypothetical protein CYY_004042 [Polysphondylium violaceum]|uniref:Ankyrin repeat-containing protein n=1 Tax=Polysphondylium violaceum TaxID=133409 RepID=A0A8J4PVU7_9MYCE|nr:hypothetical protein CYY_004042 [Polysphondylium violaceum]